jgi:hypothetical protein
VDPSPRPRTCPQTPQERTEERPPDRSSLQDTPPKAHARDHDWRQVSWLAGQRLRPPSQGLTPQWYLWPAARRLQLRGQPRLRASFNALTAFPLMP